MVETGGEIPVGRAECRLLYCSRPGRNEAIGGSFIRGIRPAPLPGPTTKG